ncbi:MAG: ABC transporter ATP-binding protein [Myxococcales bacterium]|nr:ABC transporter ATP-binding protein [Myxococcales bacterium]
MTASVVSLRNVSKVYSSGRVEVRALDDVSLEIFSGELLAIMGPSGSGKTTLMEVLGCLMQPTSGSYYFNGRSIESFAPDELASLRGEEIGFIFQAFNLLPRLNAIENVELPLSYRDVRRKQRHERAREVLVRVGLEARMKHLPSELSGGERQRVAIARALVNHPSFILADEPTGNLDSKTGGEIMDLLHELRSAGSTIVMVTHDERLGAAAERRLFIRDGQVQSEAEPLEA